MLREWILALAVVGAQPAAAQYALFSPDRATVVTDRAVGTAVVARASDVLDRPPGAIPELHTEGTLPGHGIRDISIAAKRDQPITLDFALAWRETGDPRFLAQATRYLEAWAGIYRMSFNPIDETGFDTMIIATDIVGNAMPRASRARIDAFWRRMAVGYLDVMRGSPKNAITNWQSHRIKLATLTAYRTGDRRLVARARAAYRKQVIANLRADGTTFDFAERDALHYVTYNLDPLMMAALAAKAHGEDWFGWSAPSGASLPRSLNWLAAFARGEKVHVEFARSRIAFDRERAAAGQKEYAPHAWDPAAATTTFALAATLDKSFEPLAAELARKHRRAPPAWIGMLRPRLQGS